VSGTSGRPRSWAGRGRVWAWWQPIPARWHR
jgi:hypothetical protein